MMITGGYDACWEACGVGDKAVRGACVVMVQARAKICRKEVQDNTGEVWSTPLLNPRSNDTL